MRHDIGAPEAGVEGQQRRHVDAPPGQVVHLGRPSAVPGFGLGAQEVRVGAARGQAEVRPPLLEHSEHPRNACELGAHDNCALDAGHRVIRRAGLHEENATMEHTIGEERKQHRPPQVRQHPERPIGLSLRITVGQHRSLRRFGQQARGRAPDEDEEGGAQPDVPDVGQALGGVLTQVAAPAPRPPREARERLHEDETNADYHVSAPHGADPARAEGLSKGRLDEGKPLLQGSHIQEEDHLADNLHGEMQQGRTSISVQPDDLRLVEPSGPVVCQRRLPDHAARACCHDAIGHLDQKFQPHSCNHLLQMLHEHCRLLRPPQIQQDC
mmetsp:Transcript_2732/g.8196  ORF Transcript_2732/g.8196 Transcript_2732/m.8196 type:complete len:326 (-) Transcript_2732:334-1311(-)